MNGLKKQLDALNVQCEDKDLWNDSDKAKRLLQQRAAVQSSIQTFEALRQELADLQEMNALAEQDSDLQGDINRALLALQKKVARYRLESLLDGEADKNDCYLSVQAGSGGTEAQDWAQMLLRMYLRWAEQRNYKTQWLEENAGQEAGIKSATVQIQGLNAYGWLKYESGIHRLVRISPFDANRRRHTSFASIKSYPVVDEEIDVDIQDKDIRVDTYRASGAGGQHVNKTDSAVRITHVPTNIVVQCQNNRSQHRNRAEAYRMLQARLYEMALAEKQQDASKERAEQDAIGWGHQIRSYVLHPYQMVKDLRFATEVGNAQGVLDGNIDIFLETALSQQTKH